jgi:hypothetical protein
LFTCWGCWGTVSHFFSKVKMSGQKGLFGSWTLNSALLFPQEFMPLLWAKFLPLFSVLRLGNAESVETSLKLLPPAKHVDPWAGCSLTPEMLYQSMHGHGECTSMGCVSTNISERYF